MLGHPRINAAAKAAIDKFGTGTNGVRTLAGTLTIHTELEETIAEFKHAEAAITYSSGYATNLAVISTLMGRGDYVLSDKLNHASIVDGCLMSGAEFRRFRHNDMDDLEHRLQQVPEGVAKMVIADAVFSMDGDVIDLPKMVELCKKYSAWLMMDEAHSVGVLGKTGRGIEEHFDLGTAWISRWARSPRPSRRWADTWPGRRNSSNIYATPAGPTSSPPPCPRRRLPPPTKPSKSSWTNPGASKRSTPTASQFITGLKNAGFDTLLTTTAIVPVLCGTDERAFALTQECQHQDLFVLPVVSPAVPEGLARLRATVTAAHEPQEIDYALGVIATAGREIGIIPVTR